MLVFSPRSSDQNMCMYESEKVGTLIDIALPGPHNLKDGKQMYNQNNQTSSYGEIVPLPFLG